MKKPEPTPIPIAGSYSGLIRREPPSLWREFKCWAFGHTWLDAGLMRWRARWPVVNVLCAECGTVHLGGRQKKDQLSEREFYNRERLYVRDKIISVRLSGEKE